MKARATVPPVLRFTDIRGQERAIGFLRRAWQRHRLAHAYLFAGSAGVGKLATARALAMGVHCEVQPFDACGTCVACRTIAAGTHPDVRLVGGPEKDRRDISIDQVRELQRELGFRAMSSHPKIGIVNDADLLTVQAQNALLKTLEEPGGESLLVLVASNATSLVPTILSRCQRVGFDPLTEATVTEVLIRHGCEPALAAALAAYADGSPGRALELDAEFFARRRGEILTRLSALRGKPFHEVAAFAQELSSEDKNLLPVLGVIASWYRDALRRDVLGASASLQNADVAARIPTGDATRSLRNLETTYGTILALRQNANRNLALTGMLLRLTE